MNHHAVYDKDGNSEESDWYFLGVTIVDYLFAQEIAST
jgi:hypothetical protein